MGNKYTKIDRFKSVISAKYLPEEILKINEISLKSYFAEQVNLEFANIWSLRAQSKPENFDAILQALKNKELLNFFKSFFKSFRKSWAYYFLPGWVFLGWFRIFRNHELLILVRQKYDLAVYFHRLRVNKTLRSIQVDRGVILTLFIFAFSAIQYIFARFKPLINPYVLVNNLPLFCYPIETIKWESLMSSDIAQRILVEEDNKIDLFDDYLLIRRNKELNLFGHIYLKDSDNDELWIWKPKKNKKLFQIFYDLDELPKYLESSYAPTEEKPDLSEAELKEFLDSNVSREFKELFNKKALASKRRTEINQIIRDQYALSIGHLNFTSILQRANEKNLKLFKDRAKYIKKYSNDELSESVRLKEFYSLIPDKDLEPFILKYPRTAFQKLKVDHSLEDLNTLAKKWGTSKNFRNKKLLNKNNSIISIRNEEFFKKYNKKNSSSIYLKDKKEINETIVNINSNDSKETEDKLNKALNNQPSSSFDTINIDLSFIKNPKLYSKLDNLFKKNKELFINVVDHFYNFKSRNKNSKVYIKPRKMSGYRYPDLNSKEIKLLLLKDFLFQNKKTDIVQIELPHDLVFTNSFLLNYPKAPDAKNLKIASAKPLKTIKYESLENLPGIELDELEDSNNLDNLAILKDSKYDVSLANNLETKYIVESRNPDDENQQEEEDESEGYDPGILEVNYKGPAALVNESNDIRVLYDARHKNVKPYISRSKDSRLIINVPFSYFTGSMTIDSLKKSLRKPDNKESILGTTLEPKDLENTEKKNTINNEGIATENSKNDIKNEYTIPEGNALRSWLLNYYSPDNPLTSTDVAFSDDTFPKLKRKTVKKSKKADPTLLEAFYDEEIDLKISKRAIYSDKKWKFFPYAEEIDDEEESDYIPLIPSKKNVILIGINSEGWQSRQPIEEDFLPFLDEIASNTELEDEETVTMSGLEVDRYTTELMGYAIAELPTADIFVPESKEIPNLEFGLVNEIDYSPLVRALFRKITTFHFDLYTKRVLNDTFGNHLVSNKRQRILNRSIRKYKNKRKRRGRGGAKNIISSYLKKPWEPLTANSWLVISQFWFAYICCIIVKETAFNYGREFISFILELISQGGFIPPMVLDELKILIGEKDPGFRIARDFTKGFRDLVGIDNLGNKLLDTLLFLRGAISNPLIAKNAQSLLLVGPPGTGKTLLVHALAHEAKVPVLTLSAQGSQEPASLERCFQEARRLAPCIVFLDEIDSMAQKRSLIIGEGDFYDNANNEEAGRRPSNYSMASEMSTVVGDLDPRLLQNKEALHMVVNRDVQNYLIDKNDREYYRIGMLSKLLTELDGVETTDGVVIIGATNRVEVLDPALLRPGRFYKHVRIGLPNKIKRMQLFNFYSDILGSDPTIPWDYLVNLTYGFSAADIATIMNESSIRAIANASLHTLETIEYGIDRITTINIDKPSSNKINNIMSFSTLRSAYYQAGKALLGTLLKYHPPIRVVHLWYRENSVRYNQILKTIQLEWLNYVFRGELEHRIIGAYGGKVGEFFFLQYQDEAIDELNISTMGSQDWAIGQNLIRLLVDKWHLYAQNTLFQEQPAMKTHFNDEEFNDVREQYLYEFSQIYENTPTATNLMGFHADKNPQTRYPLSWWQMKIYEQYLLDELQKWFSVWLDDPEEWKLNIHWVPPDRTFHQNPFLENITEIIKVDDFTSLVNDYQIHSIVMEAFNLGVVVLDEYRELLDELVYELLAEEILREHTIYEICTNFGIDCDNLKEDLYNSEIKIEPLPQFKILYPSWGVGSAKPTIRWIDIAAITGETPDYGPEISNEDLDESLASDEKINKDLEESNITIDDAVESMKKEITDTNDVTSETSSEDINKNLEEAGASENENEEATTDEDEKKQIHILSTFYQNIIKENSYIFSKKEIEPPLDSSSNEENQ